MRVARPRCEYLEDPLGIDVRVPRLGWWLEADERGTVQSAYQVQVASDRALLSAGTPDLWDCGRVESDASTHVEYGGRLLGSRTRCHWRVRAWDGDGKAGPYSAAAMWEMGLLKRSDWKASWIGFGPRTTKEPRPAAYMRTEFKVRRKVRRARIYVSALGLYQLSLDGRVIGDEVLTPGWTDYRKRVPYLTYDLTSRLRPGPHALGLVLAEGWYAGHVNMMGRQLYGTQPAAIAQLEIEYDDGRSVTVVTDKTWLAAGGPILSTDLQMGETYDARRETRGWDRPGYRAPGWSRVQVMPKRLNLEAQRSQPVRRTQEVHPVRMSRRPDGSAIFDLGQNMVGWTRLKINGKRGSTIRLRHAEVLDANGGLYIDNLRNAKATDYYTLKGRGLEVHEPSFTFHGFRYVEVSGHEGRLGRDAITGIVVHSDTPVTGKFECSHKLLNKLQSNITWGQRGNFLHVPTDCPQRDERLGWTGDAQVFAPTACFNMDVAAFFTKWMQDVVDAQSENGAFPDFAPRLKGGDGAPGWGDAGVIVPWAIYQAYGDTRICDQHFNAMEKWVGYVLAANPDLLWTRQLNNNYGDWVSINANSPKEVVATAYFALSTGLLAGMAQAIGRSAAARKYERLAAAIKAAFNKAYVKRDGRIQGDTQTVYAIALAFGLLPEKTRPLAVRHLADRIRNNKGHLSTGFLGVSSLLPALADTGHLRVAYRLLLEETYPSWLYPVKNGATTIWERWDGWTTHAGFQTPEMNSFNHYAFGCVGAWMYANVGGIGIDETAPGYKRIIIRPRPGGGLRSARAELQSIHGHILSSWTLRGGRFRLDVVIPTNTSATVHVPARSAAKVLEGGRPVTRADGVRFLRKQEGAAVFEVGSGRYSFSSTMPAPP